MAEGGNAGVEQWSVMDSSQMEERKRRQKEFEEWLSALPPPAEWENLLLGLVSLGFAALLIFLGYHFIKEMVIPTVWMIVQGWKSILFMIGCLGLILLVIKVGN